MRAGHHGYRGQVLAQLRTGKWLGLTALLLLLIVAFGALSYWQWERAQRDRVDPDPVPVAQVLDERTLPTSAYGLRVAMTGRYDAAHQVLVRHSPTAFWVVTPLQPERGPAVPVARATVSSPDDPAVRDVTAGVVTVVGVAQPFEGDPGSSPTLPAGQIDRITTAGLALPYPAVGGWVALRSQDPPPAVVAEPVVAPYSAEGTAPLRLQNVSYALQWVLFAGFVVFFWWRMLRDDVRGARGDVGDATAPPQARSTVPEVY